MLGQIIFIERIIILKSRQTVTREEISSILHVPTEQAKECTTLEEAEKIHIENTLRKTKGVVGGPQGAATLLGVKRPTLQYRMKKLGIDPSHFKP